MALPKGDQYNEAVQNPKISFSDADLRASEVESDFMGLPKPYSGGFTVTFKLQNAQNSWAVRCIIRNISGLKERYQAITNFLSGNTSAYFIEAKFLQDGIRVNGTFYPVIKMKWMEGEPLNIYLSNCYTNKDKVQAILNDFLKMIDELGRLGIAHGDLQQGNIIVRNGRLFLIDYDGIYLPALKGLPSNELGHPNFQHPGRSAKDFDEKIDRFSAIVIYLSLKAILHKPSLWSKYHNSENLIIRSKDISDLAHSPLMADLNAISEMKQLVERFVGVCHLEFYRIPSLKEFINGTFVYDKTKVGKIAVKGSQYEVLDGSRTGSILEHYGERVEVVGYINTARQLNTVNGKPYYFLNFGVYPNQTFTITVWSDGIASLTAAGVPPSSLARKWVSVVGVITSYRGNPQIVADLASQIQILQNEQEAGDRLQLKRTTSVPLPQPISPAPLKGYDKEQKVFDNLYQNYPVYNPPPAKPAPKPTPIQTPTPVQNYTPPTQYSTPSSSYKPQSSGNSNNGCIVPIVLAFIGAIAVGVATDGKFWFIGAIVGGIIGGWISSAFK
jgi:hypothetical protein